LAERASAVTQIEIGEDAAGQRIDNFLARVLKGVPKSHIYRILRSGEVRLNKKRAGPDTRLHAGDVVRVPPIRTAAKAVASSPAPRKLSSAIRILHEDDALLVIDKPAGLAVHGGSGVAHGLIEQLRAARPDARFLELAHRLDRDTSGVLLVAKTRAALVNLHTQLREGSVDKRYLVLVRGRWRDEKRVVRLAVHRFVTREGERRVRVEAEGQDAITVFRRVRVWRDRDPPLALLEAELKTGRTHQIRVHLTHLGFPIAGDDKYGDFAWNRELAKRGLLKRMFLHARRIELRHPATGAKVVYESALPADVEGFIASLGRPGDTDVV
jgi:23S rRNA pseudouridine955/2504/2580 synthase